MLDWEEEGQKIDSDFVRPTTYKILLTVQCEVFVQIFGLISPH